MRIGRQLDADGRPPGADHPVWLRPTTASPPKEEKGSGTVFEPEIGISSAFVLDPKTPKYATRPTPEKRSC